MRRVPSWVPWTVAAVSLLALVAAGIAGATVDPSLHVMGFTATDVGWWLTFATFTVLGAVVASRRPENPIGWVMLAAGVVDTLAQAAGQYGVWGLVRHPGSLPGASVAAWVSSYLWEPAIALVIALAMLFPTGRLLSRRWLWLPVVLITATSTIVVVSAIGLWRFRGPVLLSYNADIVTHTYVGTVIAVVYPVVLICALAALASVVLRYRRSHGVERQQLKWLMLAALVSAPGVITGQFLTTGSRVADFFQLVSTPAWFAIAAGLAILRYRLYDIDRIVSRTVSYAVVTGLVVGVYVGLIALTETVIGFSSGVAVAASTLVAAAVFQPVRRRVQHAIDRRFDRAAYDAKRTAEAFAQRLRDEVDVDMITADLMATVDAAIAPSTVTMWVAHA